MKAIFFVSFCVAMLMVNFANANDEPQNPVTYIPVNRFTSRLYPRKVCTCTLGCKQRDANKIMASFIKNRCETRDVCDSTGGDGFCVCGDNRCYWKQGESHDTFTVKLPQYPLYECQCSKKSCRRSEAIRQIRDMVRYQGTDYGREAPCERDGFCHCRRFVDKGDYAYPIHLW